MKHQTAEIEEEEGKSKDEGDQRVRLFCGVCLCAKEGHVGNVQDDESLRKLCSEILEKITIQGVVGIKKVFVDESTQKKREVLQCFLS